ncbi:MAG: hypothetical protein KKC99_09225 [Proteobacteria bacterium]|nr:hypothetical protein [Pseudomonadota bacterium]
MTESTGLTLRDLERRHTRLTALGEAKHDEYIRAMRQLRDIRAFLALAPDAVARMEELSSALFGEILDEIETNLSHAVREVLGQDRTVSTLREIKGNRLTVHFQIYSGQDQEQVEDILTGQGGSVANILSVGLRLIALSQLDEHRHRPFLVLDEQDCWLKPELVPVFMKLISQIAERLHLQLLVISHHPLDRFSGAAESILALRPGPDGPTLDALKDWAL